MGVAQKILMIQRIWARIFGDRTFGALRSSQWPRVRKEYLRGHEECEVCGKRKGLLRSLEAHHILPFHLFPDKELEIDSLVAVCRSCHWSFCHFFSWASFNKDIKQDIKRIKNRP